MKNYLLYIHYALAISFGAILFLVPLTVYHKTFELFEFNKLWVTFGLAIVILFLWVSKMILTGKIIFKRTPFDIPILLFLLSQIISTIFSIESHTSFWGYYGRFNGGLTSIVTYIFLYYAFVSNFTKQSETSENQSFRKSDTQMVQNSESFEFSGSTSYRMLVVGLLSGFAVAVWGFSSHFGYDMTCFAFRKTFDVSCWTDSFQPTVRLFSTLGQPNWLAAYFSILLPLSIGLGTYKISLPFFQKKSFSFDKDFFIGVGFLLLSLLMFLELLWTQSQSGYAGFIFGMVFYFSAGFFVLFSKTKHDLRNFKFILVKATFGILVVLFAFSFFTNNTLQAKIPILTFSGVRQMLIHENKPAKTPKAAEAPVGELGGSDSGKIRLAVWKGAIEIFKQNLLFGTGVETFGYAYYKVKPLEHNLLSEWDFLYNKAHNEYLNYLATTGSFGLGSYLIIIFSVLGYGIFQIVKAAHSKIEKPQDLLAPIIVVSLISGYISILVSNFFGFSVVVVNIYFFLIPALLLSFSKKQNEEPKLEWNISPLKVVGIIAVGIFCLLLEANILKIWLADQSYALGYNLNRAQQYVQANPQLEDAAKLFPEEDVYNSELSLNLATLGLLFYQQNQKDHGDVYIKRAKTLSDQVIQRHPHNIVFYKTRIQLLFELSQTDPKVIDQKYYNEALDAISYAQTLGPTDAKIAYNAGLLYGQAGDLQQARAALEKAIILKPNYKEPRYALAIYLVEISKKEQDIHAKQIYIQKAKEQLSYILENISQGDKATQDLLKSIE